LNLSFAFAHAARGNSGVADVMSLTIIDLGPDQTFGTADDVQLFEKQYSAPINPSGANVWTTHDSSSEPDIPAPGNSLRMEFTSVSTGSGSASIGNFLDDVSLELTIPAGFDIYECGDVDTVQAIPI